jgi:hypothetical protein
MSNDFQILDYAVFVGYAILILGVGLWSFQKKIHLSCYTI